MEHHGIVRLGWQAGDGVTLARVLRVAMGGHDHAQCGAAVPLQFHLVELAVSGSSHHVAEVAFQAHEDGLRLGVAHAAVEFERLGLALGVDHQAGVQEAGVRDAILFHATDRGQDDFAHGAGMYIGRDHWRGRIRTHAAGVGAFVAVFEALVVLAGGQGQHVLAVAQHDETGFFAFKEFLDHHTRATFVVGHAVFVVHQHEVHSIMGLLQRHGHDHALARRQAVGLDDDGRAQPVHKRVGRSGVGEGVVVGRGDAMAAHEGLGKGLGAFELGSSLGGAEDAQAIGTELIDHTRRQWRLGAHHRQCDLFGLRPHTQFAHVGDGHVLELGIQRGAAIARRHIHLGHLGGLAQFPRHRVFTAAATNHKYFHRNLW